MTKQELNNKIETINNKAALEVELLKRQFEITQIVPYVKCSVFESFVLFRCETKEQLKEVLTAFPAEDKTGPNPFFGHEQIPYNFQYQIGIDNNIDAIRGRIKYANSGIGEVWVNFDPAVLQGYLCVVMRKVYETELHYFPGMSTQQIGKIRALSFGEKGIRYYGGDEKLKCEEAARQLISQFAGL